MKQPVVCVGFDSETSAQSRKCGKVSRLSTDMNNDPQEKQINRKNIRVHLNLFILIKRDKKELVMRCSHHNTKLWRWFLKEIVKHGGINKSSSTEFVSELCVPTLAETDSHWDPSRREEACPKANHTHQLHWLPKFINIIERKMREKSCRWKVNNTSGTTVWSPQLPGVNQVGTRCQSTGKGHFWRWQLFACQAGWEVVGRYCPDVH